MVHKYALIGAASLLVSCAVTAKAAPASSPAPSATHAPVAQPITPVTTARIVMLRVYVADIARAEKFYHEVFGTTVVQKLGENVRVTVMPGGAFPGIILIQSPDEVRMNGSWVMQVSNVEETLAKAQANGATLMHTEFAENVGGMPARSTHLVDPDGNIIEVLQVGAQVAK